MHYRLYNNSAFVITNSNNHSLDCVGLNKIEIESEVTLFPCPDSVSNETKYVYRKNTTFCGCRKHTKEPRFTLIQFSGLSMPTQTTSASSDYYIPCPIACPLLLGNEICELPKQGNWILDIKVVCCPRFT